MNDLHCKLYSISCNREIRVYQYTGIKTKAKIIMRSSIIKENYGLALRRNVPKRVSESLL